MAAEMSAVLSSASAQTLTLAIDRKGRIRQHDRGAGDILADKPGSLLDTDLGELIAGPGDPAEALNGLIEATLADRDSTTVLSIRTASRSVVDAVVTVEPIRSNDPELLAQVVMRIPPPAAERFVDPALMRHALLDGAVRRIGGALDIEQMAPELVNILVPHFCNAADLLILESVMGDGEHPDLPRERMQLFRRLAIAHDDGDAGWEAAFPVGEILRYPPGTPYTECITTHKPVCVSMSEEAAANLARAWVRTPVSRLVAGSSMLLLPLLAGETLLGFFVCVRRMGFHRFDAYDTEIGMEFTNRAALFMDSARRYSRERATALTLQRSMLPTGLSHPASVEVRQGYLPGSKLIEVGGDWHELGEFEPHFATCVYAIFDSVDGTCEVASAGHLPPLLVRPDGSSEFLDVSPAPPLGIGASPIGSRTLQIEDGSLLVMYTDGLVEKRTEDIDQGLTRLQKLFGPQSPTEPLEDLCKLALAGVYDDHQRDDIAILMARLRRISSDRHVTWSLAPKLTAARRARSLIMRPLRHWGLSELIPAAELVVSELVTNAVRYAQSKISLRLVLEGALFCEILDDSAALPRLRQAADDDERGRGLQVVSQVAQRWGTRRTGTGKVVWCELALPPGHKIDAGERKSLTRPGDDHDDTAGGPSSVQAAALSPA